MNSKLVPIIFSMLLVGIAGTVSIGNVDAIKGNNDSTILRVGSDVVCGIMLCSDVKAYEFQKSERMAMEHDKKMMDDKMMDKTKSSMHGSMDLMLNSAIQTILDKTDYSYHANMDVISELGDYLSTVDASNLEAGTIKEITSLVFAAQHEQLPLELAIYEIYEHIIVG